MPVQHELLVILAPRDELQRVFIQYVVFRRLNVSRVYIETNHGADEGHADLFLPGLFRSAEGDFNCGGFACLQLEQELGVLHPGAGVRLVFKFFVVEVAPASATFLPLRAQHDVLAVSELLDFYGLR